MNLNLLRTFYFKSRQQLDSMRDNTDRESAIHMIQSTITEDFASLDHNDFIQALISLWYAMIANTEAVCYLAVFVNQMANSSVISLPLPFLVLYWGALTIPRPTKRFWITLITYTLAMILVKCIIHQKIELDYKLIKIATTLEFELFIKRSKAGYDLFLLVMLFWHRYMLKKQGIWNTPKSSSELLFSQAGESYYKP